MVSNALGPSERAETFDPSGVRPREEFVLATGRRFSAHRHGDDIEVTDAVLGNAIQLTLDNVQPSNEEAVTMMLLLGLELNATDLLPREVDEIGHVVDAVISWAGADPGAQQRL